AAALDRGVVNEEILAGVIGSDEPEALVVVEPLDGSCCHLAAPSGVRALRNAEGAVSNDCGARSTAFSRAVARPVQRVYPLTRSLHSVWLRFPAASPLPNKHGSLL